MTVTATVTDSDTGESASASALLIPAAQFPVLSYQPAGAGVELGAAIAAAQAAAVAAGGGTLTFPSGVWTVNGSGPLVPASNVIWQGEGIGATTLEVTAAHDLVSVSGVITGWFVRDLTFLVDNTTGNVITFQSGAELGQCGFSQVGFVQPNAGSYQIYGPNCGLIETLFEKCAFYSATSPTVPQVYLVTSDNAINLNVFRECRATGSGDYYFHLESNSGSGFCSNNRFDTVNFEACNGGLIRLYSCAGTIIENCGAYDLGTTTHDLIYIGKNTGAESEYTTVRGCVRAGGTLGSGLVDIRVGAAKVTLVDSCDSETLSGYTIDCGDQWVTVLGNYNGLVIENTTYAQIISPAYGIYNPPLYPGPSAIDGFVYLPVVSGAPTGTPRFGKGAACYDGTHIWVWSGTAWQSH